LKSNIESLPLPMLGQPAPCGTGVCKHSNPHPFMPMRTPHRAAFPPFVLRANHSSLSFLTNVAVPHIKLFSWA
jgi:hypothetical protein